MIHYSPYPAEWVFYDETNQQVYYQIEWEGVPLVIQMDEQGQATVVQLLSCNPQHFLDPRFQPGNKIQLFPKIWH
jgi:hypothetical protein